MEFVRGLGLSTGNNPYYLNPQHPNFERWQRSFKTAFERGKFVKSLVEKFKPSNGLCILDVGSGFGGTIQNFLDETNYIYSVEIDENKLKFQPDNQNLFKQKIDAFQLKFEEGKFDLIILQDFIEHMETPGEFINFISNFLKKDGIIYLSTPNKLSIINLISDPHWGFPLVSLFSRKLIKKIFIPLFRPLEKDRIGIAELISLKSLRKIFSEAELDYHLHTKFAAQEFFRNPHQFIWSDLHLFFFRILNYLKLEKLILKIVNNKAGFLNNFITPTFFFILKKKN